MTTSRLERPLLRDAPLPGRGQELVEHFEAVTDVVVYTWLLRRASAPARE